MSQSGTSAGPFDLSGRAAVVVGATSGIGRCIALSLARAGADVVPTGRRQPLVDQVADEIAAQGRRTLRVAADVGDRDALMRLRDETLVAFGAIDILVNAAGAIKRAPTLTFAESEWDAIVQTNLTGAFRACQVFGEPMIAREKGCIINIASLTAFVALTEAAAYGASKAGLMALTRSLAVEWAPKGVRVNAIVPGIIRTDFNSALLDGTARGQELLARTPMRRFGRADEIGGAAVFLAADASSFMTGQAIVIDGGMLASGVNQ